MLCTGTQSSGGQAVRMSANASSLNASRMAASPFVTLRLPSNSASTSGGNRATIASNQRSAVNATRRHDCASSYAPAQDDCASSYAHAFAQAPCEHEFVLTIIGHLFCLVDTRRRALGDRCTLARLCALPLQLLPPQPEFDFERFGAIGNGRARCAERGK